MASYLDGHVHDGDGDGTSGPVAVRVVKLVVESRVARLAAHADETAREGPQRGVISRDLPAAWRPEIVEVVEIVEAAEVAEAAEVVEAAEAAEAVSRC